MTATALALVLAGCTVGPDFAPPAAPAVTHYTAGLDPEVTVAADGSSQHFSAALSLPPDWWRLFDCPQLDEAVRQGLAASPTVAVAEANLRAARDDLGAGQGIFYPQVDAGLGVTRQRPSHSSTPEKLREGVFNLFTLSATITYALDVFGGERRTVEALAATVDFQRNVARAASLTLASNIANAMIAAAAYEAEIKATSDIIEIEREQVRLAGVRAQAGTIAYAGVLGLQAQLEATEALLPPLRQKLIQSQDLLAVLVGRLPAEWQPPRVDFTDLSLPRALPVSLPSALVRQRPDILQAEASLHAASAGIGIATAALFPSITLSGTIGVADTSTAGLLASDSKVWGIGAGLTQPIFHGGTLLAQRNAAINAYQASAANYRQTVLVAFQQVADTLRALEHDAEALEVTERSMQTASRALKLT